MEKIQWTKIRDPEFQKEMHEAGHELLKLMLSTSGSEEGLNVLLTIVVTAITNMSEANWEVLMRTGCGGLSPGYESSEAAIKYFLNGLDRLRTMANDGSCEFIKRTKMED